MHLPRDFSARWYKRRARPPRTGKFFLGGSKDTPVGRCGHLTFDFFGGLMISLAGKAALITGGSRGIGAAAAKLFAQAGPDAGFNYVKAKNGAPQVQPEAGKHSTLAETFKA